MLPSSEAAPVLYLAAKFSSAWIAVVAGSMSKLRRTPMASCSTSTSSEPSVGAALAAALACVFPLSLGCTDDSVRTGRVGCNNNKTAVSPMSTITLMLRARRGLSGRNVPAWGGQPARACAWLDLGRAWLVARRVPRSAWMPAWARPAAGLSSQVVPTGPQSQARGRVPEQLASLEPVEAARVRARAAVTARGGRTRAARRHV